MKVLNYNRVLKAASKIMRSTDYDNVIVHKKNNPAQKLKVSIILLDWECRERFHTLDWLLRQDIPKHMYEVIWVELYNRVVPEVLQKADTVITCGQKGMYHKHIGYNLGVLNSHGRIIVISDSDAIYPKDFISSVIKSFCPDNPESPEPLVLAYHQMRTSLLYPDGLTDSDQLKDDKWQWWPINPNAGACMAFRRQDVIRFGGFDEHKTFSGYLCGPYDLGWRLVNAGIPEQWYDTSTVLWHFAHPDPVGVNGMAPTLRLMRENTYPHVDLHALTAVEALSTGRFQPLKENPEIFKIRMKDRYLGTEFEEKYANMTGQHGFSRVKVFRLKVLLFMDVLWTVVRSNGRFLVISIVGRLFGEKGLNFLRRIKNRLFAAKDPNQPEIVIVFKGFNIIAYKNSFYGLPQSLGPVDFHDEKQLSNPAIIKSKSHRKLKKEIYQKAEAGRI